MPNSTKNSMEHQKSPLKLILGTLLSSYLFSNFLVFISLFTNSTTVAIRTFSQCSAIAKLLTVTFVVYTITRHCEFTVVSYSQCNFLMCGLFIYFDSVLNKFILKLTKNKVSYKLHLLENDITFQYKIHICQSSLALQCFHESLQ